MSRIRVFRTASFRLAAIYLALFTLSAGALGGFVYLSVRHEILADFDAESSRRRTRFGGRSSNRVGTGSQRPSPRADRSAARSSMAFELQTASGSPATSSGRLLAAGQN